MRMRLAKFKLDLSWRIENRGSGIVKRPDIKMLPEERRFHLLRPLANLIAGIKVTRALMDKTGRRNYWNG
jgi:hypothetical protein